MSNDKKNYCPRTRKGPPGPPPTTAEAFSGGGGGQKHTTLTHNRSCFWCLGGGRGVDNASCRRRRWFSNQIEEMHTFYSVYQGAHAIHNEITF